MSNASAVSPPPGPALRASALGWVVAARAVLVASGGRSLPKQERLLGWLAAHLPALPCTVDEAARAITAAGRLVPGTRCLGWSLALCALLAQARISAELRIGVAAPAPGGIEAHAWVSSGGRDWNFGGDAASYEPLLPRSEVRELPRRW